MSFIRLGATGLSVESNGFGALPIQRIAASDAVRLLRKALDGGMNYFDSARFYTDSEEKIGEAFRDRREQAVIATKTAAQNAEGFWKDLETSLRKLKTSWIDVYQFHNPSFCPKPGDGTGLYEAALKAREQGKIRFIGLTNHRRAVALEAAEAGLYSVVQYPLSYLSDESDLEVLRACERRDVGFVAMKALSGGLITDSAAACAYLARFQSVLPIWGIQRESELDEFLSYVKKAPAFTQDMQARIEKDRKQLSGEFCRGCGYCMPCPAGIEINNCARMSLLLRRAPLSVYLSEEWRGKMAKIQDCLHCGKCASKCPYKLDTPALLRANWEDYQRFLN